MKQNGFFAEVIRTSRIKVDDNSHALPPHLGAYSEFKVADYFCPEEWSNDGIFIPVKEGDPLWFDFGGNDECAILCAVQRINPVTGEPADLESGLSKDPAQNYLTMPTQRWLDGYAKEGKVYQFVVTKAGIGLAVNEFVLPKHMQDSHAIGFAFFGPKNPKPTRSIRQISAVSQPTHLPVLWGAKGLVASSSSAQSLNSAVPQNTSGGEHSFDSLEQAGGDISESLCCSSIDEGADEGTAVCDFDGEFRNRVADNYNEVDIETVDILAAQDANLNELDKASMGAGGRISQDIVTDNNTTDYYHEKRSALLTIYFALPEMYDAIMKKGKRQDASKKDKYKTSGHIGGVAVPLITGDEATQ